MKKLFYALFAALLAVLLSSGASAESKFKFARARVKIVKPCQEDWDVDMDDDENFLTMVKEMTTLDVDTKCYVVEFKDIKEVSGFSMIKIQASRPAIFTDEEIKVMKEYIERGGLIFGDDHHEGGDPAHPVPGALGTQDEFYRGMIKTVEEKIYPGKKMFKIPLDHPIFHCYFELPNGWPICVGLPHNIPMGYANEKDGHLMIILFGSGLQGGWSSPAKWNIPMTMKRQAVKAGVNMLVYGVTH
jgi:hypothetical protein